MKFSEWIIAETNLENLFNKTIEAFPSTKHRQHSIDFIRITELHWTPYMGLRTLFVKGLAENIENKKEYNPLILFKKINFIQNENSINIKASNGNNYSIEKINNSNDVSVRCDCKDFYWRGNYYNHLDKSLYGSKRARYESQGLFSVNPTESPMMCKHIIKLALALENAGIFESLPFKFKR